MEFFCLGFWVLEKRRFIRIWVPMNPDGGDSSKFGFVWIQTAEDNGFLSFLSIKEIWVECRERRGREMREKGCDSALYMRLEDSDLGSRPARGSACCPASDPGPVAVRPNRQPRMLHTCTRLEPRIRSVRLAFDPRLGHVWIALKRG